jgi:multiple sugar transport system permease protein
MDAPHARRRLAVPRKVRRTSHRQRREALNAYIFMAPAILGLLFFTLGPMVASIMLSFTEYNILTDPRLNCLAIY